MPEKHPPVGIIIARPSEIMPVYEAAVGTLGLSVVSENFWIIKDDPEVYTHFIRKYDPRVLIVDIPPPYAENQEFAQFLAAREESADRRFVYTTTSRNLARSGKDWILRPTATYFNELIDAVSRDSDFPDQTKSA